MDLVSSGSKLANLVSDWSSV